MFSACLWNFVTTPSQSLPAAQKETTVAVEGPSLETHKQAPFVGQKTKSCCWKDGGQSKQL